LRNQKLKPTKLTSDIISPFKWHVMSHRRTWQAVWWRRQNCRRRLLWVC